MEAESATVYEMRKKGSGLDASPYSRVSPGLPLQLQDAGHRGCRRSMEKGAEGVLIRQENAG
jgi:hypothetical protein